MSAAADGAAVAFEVDDYQLADRSGWSVLAVGRAELIHAVATTFKVLDAGLEPLADGRRTAIVRIEPTFSRVRLAGTRPRARRSLGLTWRQLTPRHSAGTWATKIRGTITRDGDGWVAYLRVEEPAPASHASPPSAASTRWTRRRWRPTRCGRPCNGGRVRRDLYVSGSDR
jgi:hypothetical protein